MKTPNILKITLPIIILLISAINVHAFDLKTRDTIGLDNTLVEESINTYSQPTKIYLTEVSGYQEKLSNNPQSWIKLLYYYSITQLQLSDIPYNYLLTEDGNIYEGKSGGVGVNPGLMNGDNILLIGYMSNKGTLTPRANDTLKTFLEELSYEYGIKEPEIETVKLKIKQSEDSLSQLQYQAVNNSLSTTFSNITSNVKWSSTGHQDYKATITSVEYEKDVVIGEKLNVKVIIKNENNFTWFSDTDYIYISTTENRESPFAINQTWDSFSKPTHIESKYVKPGDEVTLNFDLLAKSKPGEYSETFEILKTDNKFPDTTFEVKFNITKGDYKLVQIYSPEYGFVNIRECRFYSCEKLEVANDGEVYIMLKEEENWYQIEFGEGKKGWVYTRYIKEI